MFILTRSVQWCFINNTGKISWSCGTGHQVNVAYVCWVELTSLGKKKKKKKQLVQVKRPISVSCLTSLHGGMKETILLTLSYTCPFLSRFLFQSSS